MPQVAAGIIPLASNFLVPNGTFLVELIAFMGLADVLRVERER